MCSLMKVSPQRKEASSHVPCSSHRRKVFPGFLISGMLAGSQCPRSTGVFQVKDVEASGRKTYPNSISPCGCGIPFPLRHSGFIGIAGFDPPPRERELTAAYVPNSPFIMSICATCRRTLLARVSIRTRPTPRYASTVPSTPNAAPSEPTMPFSKADFSAVKPITIQPLSTPDAAPPSIIKPAAKTARKSKDLQGSIPGGEELKGMGYTKAKPRVLAKEDAEYPEWLWTLLDEKATELGTSKVDLNGERVFQISQERC